MLRTFALTTFVVLSSLPLAAGAQCRSDVECKGDRICLSGRCVDPAARAPGAAPARTPAPLPPAVPEVGRAPDAPHPGWGRTGGIIGLVGAGTTLGLALVAEGMNSDGTDATGVGAAAILVATTGAVLAGTGSASVRGVPHSKPLRIAGWIAFGLAVGDALVLVGTPGEDKPTGLITSVGALAFAGVGALSLEAILSANAADRARTARSEELSLSPWVAPVRLADGTTGTGFGLAGSF